MTVPKLCECGCGQPTPLAKRTDHKRGLVAGQPVRFIRGHAGSAQARVVRAARAGRSTDLRPIRGPQETRSHAEVYAEELLHISELLVGAVHDDGPDELRAHVAAALGLQPPPGVNPVEALVAVLAAQIDPDTTAEQRLGWVRRFATPQPITSSGPLPVRASPRKENAA